MREDIYPRIFQGLDDPAGHFALFQVKARVHRSKDDLAFLKDVVLQVQASVREDVHFHPFQDAHVRKLIVHFFNFLQVFGQLFFTQTAGHAHSLGMVGDGDVGVAHLPGLFRHIPDGVFPIRGHGMHLQIAPYIGQFDQTG